MKIRTIALLAPMLICTPAMAGDDTAALTKEARGIVKSFFGELKGELVGAMKAGGPIAALGVCNAKAPVITDANSKSSGWDVGRTSLRLRNASNEPDQWENAILNEFEHRKMGGEDPTKMDHAQIVTNADGSRVFRYMKAIPTAEKPCLMCHGGKVKPEIAAKLKELYPNDEARGYKAGDIRGAFTLQKKL